MKKKLPGYKKLNLIIVSVCFLLIGSLSVGYSILESQLDINANAYISSVSGVNITSVNNFTSADAGYEIYDAQFSDKSVTLSAGLPQITSTVTYDITIKNFNNYTMAFKSSSLVSTDNENITYELINLNKTNTILANDTYTFQMVLKYHDISEIPEKSTINLTVSLNFIEYTPSVEVAYAEGNLDLDLRGMDEPVNGKWISRDENNKEVTLYNVSYSSYDHLYKFEDNAYGNLNQSVIPETGDFTLETFITTPTILTNKDDQAIISQVNDNTNDAGRFKINYAYKIPNYSILAFTNETAINNNTFDYASKTVLGNNNYVIQYVRSGGYLYAYLNGMLYQKYNFPSGNKISQANFKIGKWNNPAPQYFGGTIHSIRCYSRALSSDEILSNFQADIKQYTFDDTTPKFLPDYIKNEYLKIEGSGLYLVDNNYIYKGININNYFKFSSSGDLYYIINSNADNTMKIVNISTRFNEAFDKTNYRNSIDSTFCTKSSTTVSGSTDTYGCNIWGSVSGTLTYGSTTGTVTQNNSLLDFLNEEYYSSLDSNVRSKILTHNFNVGSYTVNTDTTNALSEIKARVWNGKIGTITTDDILQAIVTTPSSVTQNQSISNYFASIVNENEVAWLMNGMSSNTYDSSAILGSSTSSFMLSYRRASRYNQSPAIFYAFPAFYISNQIYVTGRGSLADPFVLANNN